MFCRRIVVAAAVAVLFVPGAALAASSWVWPVGPTSTLVPYGAAYVAPDGRRCTHGGVDIATPTGTRVGACAAGQVVFAGAVPAGSGQRTAAVTVATDDGLRVTYLPLDAVVVHVSGRVEAGDTIGQVAAAGDGSSAEPHLHVGVKRGSRQLDPMAFLAAASAPSPGPGPRPLTQKGAPECPTPGLPEHTPSADAASSHAARAASDAAARAAVDAGAAGPVSDADVQVVRASVGSALDAMRAASVMEALPTARVPAATRVAQVVVAAVRARDGIAWVVVRLMLVAAGVLCLRPALQAMRGVGAAPEPVAVRRMRT
jgi:hypothetical protein